MTAEQVRHHLRRAVRHFDDLDTRGLEQRGRRDVRMAADARVADGHLAGPRFRVGEKLSERLPRSVGAHSKHRRLDEHTRHRIERTIVERELAGVIGRRNRVGVPHQRITVGLLTRDMLVADRAAGARSVHDDHLPGRCFDMPSGEQPRRDVRRGTGREQHRQLDTSLSAETAAPGRPRAAPAGWRQRTIIEQFHCSLLGKHFRDRDAPPLARGLDAGPDHGKRRRGPVAIHFGSTRTAHRACEFFELVDQRIDLRHCDRLRSARRRA